VAGAIFAAVELGARPDVIAILPMAENMPGSRAQRPGDVVTHPGGQRTEVIDTDSEGRLVLADAIAYLVQRGVAGIVDVGTLTDGGGVGPLHWGCWGTGETLAGELLAAGVIAGEPGWRLPLHTDYLQFLESRTADVANAPRTTPDSGLMAATYLRTFAGEVPWAHIDNGGSAYLESDFAGWTAGATGSPMRALLQFLLDRG
jgi:leucyl aminopeptidase